MPICPAVSKRQCLPKKLYCNLKIFLGRKGRKRFITVFCGENGYDKKNYQYRDFGI